MFPSLLASFASACARSHTGANRMETRFTFTSGALPPTTSVLAFKGYEALSVAYSFEVNVHIPHEDTVELEDVVGDRATLTIDRQRDFAINGYIATFELLNETSTHGVFRA